ncbi:MAG TPA: chaplin family protein [Thermobifida alba]|nr:chaplin family protein [Thermobifida alba]
MRKTMLASTAVLVTGLAAGIASPAAADQIASGNTITIPVDVALDVCGNTITAVGDAEAACQKFIEALQESSGAEADTSQSGEGDSLASDNTITIPVDAALDLCGNTVAVLGAPAGASCTTVVEALQEASDDSGSQEIRQERGEAGGSGDRILSGNEVNVPVDADVDVCGNAVAVLGSGGAECEERTQVTEETGTEETEAPRRDAEKPAEDAEAPVNTASNDRTLPVTGAALGGLVAAAVAALGGGGAAMYLARRKKAAAKN